MHPESCRLTVLALALLNVFVLKRPIEPDAVKFMRYLDACTWVLLLRALRSTSLSLSLDTLACLLSSKSAWLY